MTQGKVKISASLKKESIRIDKHGKVIKREGDTPQKESKAEKKARLLQELKELE